MGTSKRSGNLTLQHIHVHVQVNMVTKKSDGDDDNNETVETSLIL